MKRLLALALVACAETPVVASAPAPPSVPPPASTWAESTHSPRPVAAKPENALALELLDACGRPDEALMLLAPSHPEELTPALRELGAPYMHATYMHATNVTGDAQVKPQLLGKLKSLRTDYSRCGIAMDGSDVHIVRAEAYADVSALPIRSRTGAWLTFEALVQAPVSSAKIVVVGPRGTPKTFPTTLDAQGYARGRFVLDHPGAFEVQLIAELDKKGTQPLAEALVFADVEPSHSIVAPGEKEPSLEAMVAAVRRDEGLTPLERDPRLDALAAAHVAKMVKLGRVAHDLGDGDFARRFQAEGYSASVVGENVARATSLALAHRALWNSPSHRLNLLHAGYTRLGLATATEGTQTWVCETFSSELQ